MPRARAGWTTPPATPWWSSIGLAVALGVCLGAGAVGGWVTASSVETWYPTIAKPDWTPSGAVIGTVWTVLYGLMGIAAWRVWRKQGLAGAKRPLGLFAGQLVLNVAWSTVFFGLQSPGGALAVIAVLAVAIAWTTVAFREVDQWAAGLMLPYLTWVLFASTLNATIWWMN